MKLLLTSAGIKNTSIHNALIDLLGKPIAEASALCIPTAGYGHLQGSPGGPWRFISGKSAQPMCELGWKSLGVLELTALPSIDKERWISWVRAADVLLVNGGDALYLCYWMRQSGLADLLPSLSETVWVGFSAGSMVMTPCIGRDFVGWKPPSGGDETLGVVDFSIFPHLDHPALPENTMADADHATRSMTRPPSKWSTKPSRSSPRGTGNCLHPSAVRPAQPQRYRPGSRFTRHWMLLSVAP
jgi:dipeptidase E